MTFQSLNAYDSRVQILKRRGLNANDLSRSLNCYDSYRWQNICEGNIVTPQNIEHLDVIKHAATPRKASTLMPFQTLNAYDSRV